jgi:hypothetical protein
VWVGDVIKLRVGIAWVLEGKWKGRKGRRREEDFGECIGLEW